jgi:hypothetical protein
MGRGRAVCVAVIAASIALSSRAIRAEEVSVPETGWTDAGVKDGVALSYREHPQLHARELRAIADAPVPARLMFAAVCDFPRYREFVPGIVESTEVERSGPNDYIAYMRYAPRFLVVAARDVVLHVSIDEEERTGAWRCSWSQVPVLRKYYVRAIDSGQEFHSTRQGGGHQAGRGRRYWGHAAPSPFMAGHGQATPILAGLHMNIGW